MQKSDWTIVHSSSHNFQNLTGQFTICNSSDIYFFTKKLT
ncbi:hypothetical protein LEP1GSC082_0857 [Leptospira kirschneri str. H2]|uniref:Uncharacterized protein n=2 Tax=Leptospira kirschneri TaxID=29507 RepID=A0A0E2B823_9LEPT|nr:hypothetical protein LEP1GSC081_3956 [Leptospira kirschneri str. H1]EKO59090.1 hypothetical protein LEP1GSC082_0857 [Leptospira kirschneri str. H2]EMK20627.1 hypothetical protein LEP1GSC008_4092 [Leptospira kirschneri serovar Bulgarica str. Nikolaevo]